MEQTDSQEQAHKNVKNLKLAFFINVGFVVLELIGGLLTNSVAILAEAIHDSVDSISLGMSWYLEDYSRKGKDNEYSFGYPRFSLLGALISGTAMIVGSCFVLWEALPRFLQPESVQAPGMLVLALIGIAVNGAAAWRLIGSGGLNLRMAAWHLIQDSLGWFAILIISVALLFSKDWHVLDPLLSIVIALFILYNAVRNLRTTLMIFLQAVPPHLNLDIIVRQLSTINQVKAANPTYVWSLDGDSHVLTTHLTVNSAATREDMLRVRETVTTLAQGWNLKYVTVEVDYEEEIPDKGDGQV